MTTNTCPFQPAALTMRTLRPRLGRRGRNHPQRDGRRRRHRRDRDRRSRGRPLDGDPLERPAQRPEHPPDRGARVGRPARARPPPGLLRRLELPDPGRQRDDARVPLARPPGAVPQPAPRLPADGRTLRPRYYHEHRHRLGPPWTGWAWSTFAGIPTSAWAKQRTHVRNSNAFTYYDHSGTGLTGSFPLSSIGARAGDGDRVDGRSAGPAIHLHPEREPQVGAGMRPFLNSRLAGEGGHAMVLVVIITSFSDTALGRAHQPGAQRVEPRCARDVEPGVLPGCRGRARRLRLEARRRPRLLPALCPIRRSRRARRRRASTRPHRCRLLGPGLQPCQKTSPRRRVGLLGVDVDVPEQARTTGVSWRTATTTTSRSYPSGSTSGNPTSVGSDRRRPAAAR